MSAVSSRARCAGQSSPSWGHPDCAWPIAWNVQHAFRDILIVYSRWCLLTSLWSFVPELGDEGVRVAGRNFGFRFGRALLGARLDGLSADLLFGAGCRDGVGGGIPRHQGERRQRRTYALLWPYRQSELSRAACRGCLPVGPIRVPQRLPRQHRDKPARTEGADSHRFGGRLVAVGLAQRLSVRNLRDRRGHPVAAPVEADRSARGPGRSCGHGPVGGSAVHRFLLRAVHREICGGQRYLVVAPRTLGEVLARRAGRRMDGSRVWGVVRRSRYSSD